MKIVRAALAAVLLAGTAAAATVNLDGFTVDLPAGFSEFTKQEKAIPTESGSIQNITHVSKSEGGDAIIISYSILGGKILDPEKMMAEGRDSLLKSVSGTADSEAPTQLDNHPGLHVSFSAKTPRELYGRTQFGVVDERMYQLIYLTGTADRRTSPEAEQFFNSFNLAEPAPETATAQ
jgi:hypothetical protein